MSLKSPVNRTIVLVTCMLTSLPLLADFDSASRAYRSQNYAVAFDEFSELARSGDARAQTVLAIMHKYGESVPVDLQKSYEWYRRAAEQGYPPAQYNVGIMLADGKGVARDPDEALIWLQRAADAGFERALESIAQVTGDTALEPVNDEPIAWSKNWNLRLPNDIRYDTGADVDLSPQVYRVQLGAMSSVASARNLWDQVSTGNEDLFGLHQPIFREAESRGRQIIRLQVGPFNERTEAEQFCEQYAYRVENATGCVVVRTN